VNTKTINLRDLPGELVRKAKSTAALNGMSLKGWVILLIEKALVEEVSGGQDGAQGHERSDGRAVSGTGSSVRSGDAGTKASVGVEDGDKDTSGSRRDVVSRQGVERSGGASGKSHQHGAAKKLTADEYYKLSNSDKLRAQREGRYS